MKTIIEVATDKPSEGHFSWYTYSRKGVLKAKHGKVRHGLWKKVKENRRAFKHAKSNDGEFYDICKGKQKIQFDNSGMQFEIKGKKIITAYTIYCYTEK